MPNPAQALPTRYWLNAALMGRAISDPARLERIFERRVVRNSLRFDPHRPRSHDSDVALAEPPSGAAVMDRRGGRGFANHVARAFAATMLELGKGRGIGDAEQHGRLVRPADFPLAPGQLSKDGRGRSRRCQSAGMILSLHGSNLAHFR